MRIAGFIVAAFAVCGCCRFARAQEGEITVKTDAPPGEVMGWLRSGDPRLVAWGASFARTCSNHAAMDAMATHAVAWDAQEPAGPDGSSGETLAMQEMLDALIVCRERVSVAGIRSVAASFPVQAAILVSRMPVTEATPLLLEWYEGRHEKRQGVLPRVAAMLLSKAPPEGFAASVVSESEAQMSVTATSPEMGMGFGGSFMSGCGSGGLAAPAADWPPIYSYALVENAETHDPLLVRSGGDRVNFQRFDRSTGSKSCGMMKQLDTFERVHLIAEMVGVGPAQIPWAQDSHPSIVWESEEQFKGALLALIRDEEAQMQATMDALCERGAMTRDEANLVRPRLAVSIADAREHREVPIPIMSSGDERTALTYTNH
jgi:hypothetical protein